MERLGRFGALLKACRIFERLSPYLPALNFITLHYCCFLFTCLISGIIFWASSTPEQSVRFIDALFFAVSAMTEAGLNTVNLSELNSWQQVMLFFLIMMGSAIFVSASVVHVRRKAFERRFRDEIEKESRTHRRTRTWFPTRPISRPPTLGPSGDVMRGRAVSVPGGEADGTLPDAAAASNGIGNSEKAPDDRSGGEGLEDGSLNGELVVQTVDPLPEQPPVVKDEQNNTPEQVASPADRITFGPDVRFRGRRPEGHNEVHDGRNTIVSRVLSMHGVGARSQSSTRRITLQTSQRSPMEPPRDFPRSITDDRRSSYVPVNAIVSRNSNFNHLTEQDRLRLGGTEYRAVVFLSWIVPIYFFLWQLLGCLALGAYIHNYYADTCRENGLNGWWVGAFNAVSAFNNSGMSLLDANMTAFNTSVFILLTMSLLILAGNTCYPVFLRLIVWSILKLLPENDGWADDRVTLQFLLDHPRRCYTNLFPAQHTWWLLVSVIMLNGIDCAAFAVLNIGNAAITRFSPGIEFIDGLFQAFAVRSGGFYVVNISSVRVSLQVLYVIMMYISAFPVAITIRNSNVYEERSLGIYADDPEYEKEKSFSGVLGRLRTMVGMQRPETTGYFVQQQLRAQLAHDIWWLVLAIFLIMVIEGGQFESNPAVFSVFNVIFEVVSAYGTVGISVGLPNAAYSFSGAWHTLSKLILCSVMIRGRHRGLPVAIDKAVLLPGDYLHDLEEEDAQIRLDRPVSRAKPPEV